MSKGQDYLTPWHRECIERGATLLVIPVEPQPGWGEPPQRSEDDPGKWYARGVDELGCVVREYAYCSFYPGTVIRVGDIRLRVTDVACKRLSQMTDDEVAAVCEDGGCTVCGESEFACECGDNASPDHRDGILGACLEMNREFPRYADGYVWLVSFEKEVGMSSNMARLAELRSAANEILAEAIGHVDDAFNAGDLRCIDAQWVVSVDGDSYYRVVISEASPDATKLQRHVFERLNKLGFGEVEVTTEW